MPSRAALLFVLLAVPGPHLNAQALVATLTGSVVDRVTNAPIPFAVIRVVGVESSTLGDRMGRFTIVLPRGEHRFEVRKIGYRMIERAIVLAEDRDITIELEPLPVSLAPVVVVGEADDEATRIIRAAIARKRDVLQRIRDYRYQAYVKLIIRDAARDPDSVASVVLITESQTSAYWEQPDRYQETIVARRQSLNLNAEDNFVSVGQIVNFNRERIDLGRYSVVSPTANDALDHYRYHLLDTLESGGRVFRLTIEPRSRSRPLFVGIIDIADSTYDVVAVEVGMNEAIRFDFFDDLRYRQRMADLGDDRWMPAEIRFSGRIEFGLPIPGFPRRMTFEHIATLRDFAFDQGGAPATLGEFLVVVDRKADDQDRAEWDAARPTPLAAAERAAYARLDSLERRPASLGRSLGDGAGLALFATTNPDFYHYNRVEGSYVGAGWTWRDLSPDVVLRTKLGRSLGRDEWQYHVGGRVRISERQRVWIGAAGFDEVVSRPTTVSAGYNPTYLALLARLDPLDYYRERGVALTASTKVVDHVSLDAGYRDVRQESVPTVTQYAFFGGDRVARANPSIAAGRLRAFSGAVTYDSRPLLKNKGRDFRLGLLEYTRATVDVEVAAPSVVANDFDYTRVGLRLRHRRRVFNAGVTTIDGYAGMAWGDLPPQRYFTVDFGGGAFYTSDGINTLGEVNFIGDRMAMIVARHDFDRLIFRHIPLVRALPFTLQVHGAVFWTGFGRVQPAAGYEAMPRAPTAYGEIGFGLGNLTPMLSPLNFGAHFTWQVSDYATQRFAFRLSGPSF